MAGLSDNLKIVLLAQGEEGYGSFENYGDVQNANWEIVESALSEKSDITINTVDVTLTDAQQQSLYLNLSGTLTGDRDLILNADQKGFWFVNNATSGGYEVTIKPSGGAGFALPQGHKTIVVSDGATAVSVVTSYNEAVDNEAVEFIGEQTASAGSAIAFTTGFSADYDDYVFEFSGVYGSAVNDSLHCRISVDGGSNWLSTAYYSVLSYFSPTTTEVEKSGSNSTSQFELVYNVHNSAAAAVYGQVRMKVASAIATLLGNFNYLYSGTSLEIVTVGGRRATSGRPNAARFFMPGGTITGTIRMYGVRHS